MTQQNAVAKRDEAQAPAAPKEPIEAGGAIAAIVPRNIEQTFRLAQALSRAGDMIPKDYQGAPDKIMAAILRGAEVGLAPMQSLSAIANINGRASLWGDALPALMQRAGHHLDVRIEGEGDKMVAIAVLERGDTGRTIERRFSVADARRAGLWEKSGPWKQYPTRMLSMRARSWACRDGAADVLMGLYVAEEASDMAPEGPNRARDVTPRRSGVSFREPDPAPEPDDRIVDAETGEITEAGPHELTEEERERLAAEVRARTDAEAAGLFSEGEA